MLFKKNRAVRWFGLFCILTCWSRLAYSEEASLLPSIECSAQSEELEVTYLGNTTLILEDGSTTLVLDGFVTRPGKLELLWRRNSNSRVEQVFNELQITDVDLVTSLHTHFDHAMDIPDIVKLSGVSPELVGSKFLRRLGCLIRDDESCLDVKALIQAQAGCFNVVLESSNHSIPHGVTRKVAQWLAAPLSNNSPDDLSDSTLFPSEALPVSGLFWSRRWVESQSYNVAISHRGVLIYVYGGTPDSFDRSLLSNADVVFVAVPSYPQSALEPRLNDSFWQSLRQTISGDSAKKVIIVPVHWDDFTTAMPVEFVGEPLPVHEGEAGEQIDEALRAIKSDINAANADYDEPRFLYHQPSSFAEIIDFKTVGRQITTPGS